MGEVKQTNFRIDQETADAFRKFCEENGLNQAQGFDHIMQVVEMDRAKTIVPERKTEIETFEKAAKDLLGMYINSLEINKNAEERIREQFTSDIIRQNKTIDDLRAKIDTLATEKADAEKAAEAAAKAAAQAIKDAEAAIEKADTASRLAAEKDRTIGTLADKLGAAEAKAEGFDELKQREDDAQQQILQIKAESEKELEVLRRELEESRSSSAREIQAEKDAAARVLKDAEKDHDVALKALREAMDRAVSEAQKDTELAVTKAVADKEREMYDVIRSVEKENARLQAKIESLQERLAEAPKAEK